MQRSAIRLCLSGDVMTGRGIDQIMPQPSEASLHEEFVQSALDYVALAERHSGAIPRAVAPDYIWGDALDELRRLNPDAVIVNLETAITRSEHWQPKGINYRMHPANIDCLRAARIDACSLANNHVLDWDDAGLLETLATLHRAGIKAAGAGSDRAEAAAPVILPLAGRGRVVLYAAGHVSSGIPAHWAATATRPGINLLPDFTGRTLDAIATQLAVIRQPGDIVIVSLHWGGNWGYAVPSDHRQFARRLIDEAGVDIVHGHSSHHPKPLEVYRNKLIIYGCGDLINDYEGIGDYGNYRGDLRLLYFPVFEQGRLRSVDLIPLQMQRFRLQRASVQDAFWLRDCLAREGETFHCGVSRHDDNSLQLHW